jgi:hypothetical protein
MPALPDPRNPPVKSYPVWKYRTDKFGPDHSNLAASLVRWGQDGWELAAVLPTPDADGKLVFVFKRPIQSGEWVDLSS